MARDAALQPSRVTYSKGKPWAVSVPAELSPTGRRQRRFFATKLEASTFADSLKVRRSNYGARAATLPRELTQQCIDAVETLEASGLDFRVDEVVRAFVDVQARLEPTGASVDDAVAFYEEWHRQQTASCTFDSLMAEFMATKRQQGKSDRYVGQIAQTASRFSPLIGGESVVSVTGRSMTETFRALSLKPTSHNAFRRVLKAAFAFGISQDYLGPLNPLDKVPRAEERRREVQILTPEQATALLDACDSETLPYFALSLFAGLRPTEAERAEWEHLDFEAQTVWVPPRSNAKESGGRIVPMEDNLAAWLSPFRGRSGRIAPERNWRRTWRAAITKAGLRDHWSEDVTRHSYASYLGALTGDIARTALCLGHSEKVHRKHYHRPISREVAERYWNVKPSIKEATKTAVSFA